MSNLLRGQTTDDGHGQHKIQVDSLLYLAVCYGLSSMDYGLGHYGLIYRLSPPSYSSTTYFPTSTY